MRSRHLAALALTALAASGCGMGVHFAEYRNRTTPPDAHVTGVSVIDVSADSGHVHVTGGGTDVTIHRVIRYQNGTPHPGQQLSAGTLRLTDGCARCAIDYDITAPASVQVRVRADSGEVDLAGVAGAAVDSDSGSVTVRDVPGDVTARSDSGSVTVQDVKGAVSARTDSGSVTADRVGGALTLSASSGSIRSTGLRSPRARVRGDSGDIRLAFAAAPQSVDAATDSGSISVGVPGGPYDIEAKTDSGATDTSGVPTSHSATAKIVLSSDSGSLTVEPA